MISALFFTGAACFFSGAGGNGEEAGSLQELKPHWDTLIAAGDTMIARWEHDLVVQSGVKWPLEGVAPLLSSADAAFSNLECCVALGGLPAEKGERCPFYYRARPEMLRILTSAGIDVVTAANNHGGDYGPSSVAETIRWTEEAGLVCAGIGRDLAEAERPRLIQVGRTRVALAGMDTTMPYFAATPDRPGTNFARETENLEAFKEKVRRLGEWARGKCDLLVLTPHWGDNWVRETQPAHRKMARIAFQNGVDLILGHSAHRLQGMEVIDGKVVLYDMGNLLFDCLLQPEGRMSALFRLSISPAGVHQVEVIPIRALLGHTVLAGPEVSEQILEEMESLCSPLGTKLRIREGKDGRPIGVLDIPAPQVTQRPPVKDDLSFVLFPAAREFSAPRADGVIRKDLPEDSQDTVKLNPPIELAPGMELLGFHLPETARERGILNITTWWRLKRPVKNHWLLAFELETAGEIFRRGTPWYTRHDPGDWSIPVSQIQPGEIVVDFYPARLSGLPPGSCEVRAVVLDPARPEGKGILGRTQVLGRVEVPAESSKSNPE